MWDDSWWPVACRKSQSLECNSHAYQVARFAARLVQVDNLLWCCGGGGFVKSIINHQSSNDETETKYNQVAYAIKIERGKQKREK